MSAAAGVRTQFAPGIITGEIQLAEGAISSHFMKGTIVKCMEELVIEKFGGEQWMESG